jgi:hypothetical protein
VRRPSAAFIISCAALMAALGGSAVAAKLITGKQIKDRSITGRDLKSNTITGRVAANLSGRDILSDSLDGTDIAENQLGTVPRARSASQADIADRATVAGRAETADALAGARVARVHFARPAGGEASVLDLGGLRLKAACSGSGAMTVTAATAGGPGWIRVSGTMQQSQNVTAPVLLEDDDFRAGDEFSVLPANGDNFAGELVYLAGDGNTVTVSFLAEQGIAASRGYACLFAGTAVQASP